MQKGKTGKSIGKVTESKSKAMKATMVLGPTPEPTPPVPAPAPNPEPPPPTPTPVPQPEPQAPSVPDLPYGADTIYNIPLLKIRIAPQVRSHVTTTEAPFISLKESIRERGVLSPVILIREASDSFLLVSGERRYWACESLKVETIPARIIAGIDDPTDRIALQLIENMIREDLDPIDEAQGYLDYLQGKRPGIAAASIVNDLVTFNMDASRLPEEVQAICRALERMAGKTAGTIRSLIALLDLPTEIREAVRYRKIGTGHGYLLATHLDHPELLTIFRSLLQTPLSLEALKKRLEKKPAPEDSRSDSMRFRNYIRSIQTMRTKIGGEADIAVKDIDRMLEEIAGLAALLQQIKAGAAKTA